MKVDRKQIHALFDGHCAYCGCILESEQGKHMQVDHIKPLRRNWWQNDMLNPENETLNNLHPSCPKCNNMKGSEELEAFRVQMLDTVRQLERNPAYQRALRFGMIEVKEWDGIFYFEKYNQK